MESQKRHIPDRPFRALAARLGLAMIGFFALLVLASATSAKLLPGLSQGDATRAVTAIAFLLGTWLALLGSPSARSFALLQWQKGREGWRTVVLAALAGIGFYAAAFALGDIDPDRIRGWRLDLGFVLGSLLLSSVFIPIVEETFFRGMAIGGSRGWHALVAVLLSSVVFAAIHPDRWLSVFIFSLAASAIYLRVGLLGAYGFHIAYNLANYSTLLLVSAGR